MVVMTRVELRPRSWGGNRQIFDIPSPMVSHNSVQKEFYPLFVIAFCADFAQSVVIFDTICFKISFAVF